MQDNLEVLLEDTICQKYPHYISRIEDDLMPKQREWSISARNHENAPTHGCNTNNYVEVSFRITKDEQFGRTKCINICEALEPLLDNSEHYSKKCIDCGNCRKMIK